MVLSTSSHILAEVSLVCGVANTVRSGVGIRGKNLGLSRRNALARNECFFSFGGKNGREKRSGYVERVRCMRHKEGIRRYHRGDQVAQVRKNTN